MATDKRSIIVNGERVELAGVRRYALDVMEEPGYTLREKGLARLIVALTDELKRVRGEADGA